MLSGTARGAIRSKLLIEKALSIYSTDQLFAYACKASNNDSDEAMVANLAGVQYVIGKLVGDDIEFLLDTIELEFINADTCQSGTINKDGFEALLAELNGGDEESPSAMDITGRSTRMERTQKMFDLKSRHDLMGTMGSAHGIDSTVKMLLHGSGKGKYSAKNWSLLYCGGSDAVLAQLKDYKKKFGE